MNRFEVKEPGIMWRGCRGWKRKIGIVTLAAAMVFLGCWFRSTAIYDRIEVNNVFRQSYSIESIYGELHWTRRSSPFSDQPFKWWSNRKWWLNPNSPLVVPMEIADTRVRKLFQQIRYETTIPPDLSRAEEDGIIGPPTQVVVTGFAIHYLLVVGTLAFVSACFLLTKSRRSTPATIKRSKANGEAES